MTLSHDKRQFPSPGDPPAGFRVPDGYFDQLSGRIMKKIRENETEGNKKIPLVRRIYLLTAAAAVFLLLLVSGLWYSQQSNKGIAGDENIVDIFHPAETGIGEEELIDFIGLEDINIGESQTGIKKETIITYLLNEGIDYDLIAEQL